MKTLKDRIAITRPVRRITLLTAILFGLSGCIIAVKDDEQNRERTSQGSGSLQTKGISQLDEGHVHEMCRVLMAGETIRFDFEASAPVSFNLHYHEGKSVTYPVEEQLLTAINNRFTAPIEQTYCLMWTGKRPDTKLVYHYSIDD